MTVPIDMSTHYLAWWDIFQYEFAGSMWLAIIIFLLLVLLLSMKFNIPMHGALMLFTLAACILVIITANEALWAITVLFVGLIATIILGKFVQR